MPKTAEEALASFLATLPNYLRRYLEGSDWSAADIRAWSEGDYKRDRALIKQYENLLQACPAKRRVYLNRQREALKGMLLPIKRGRPRKDLDVQESLSLKAAGKTWPANRSCAG